MDKSTLTALQVTEEFCNEPDEPSEGALLPRRALRGTGKHSWANSLLQIK